MTVLKAVKNYKYDIHRRLHTAEMSEYGRKKFRERMRQDCNISERTYDHYVLLKENDTEDIPTRIMAAFARNLYCTIDDLIIKS